MEVIVTPEAKKALKKLPKVTQIAVIEKLKKLELDQAVDVRQLVGYRNAFRVRVGNYRIVYKVISRKIYVVLTAHRKEVYKILERLLK